MENSKQAIAEKYSTNASDYDHIRLTEPRGLLLSEHDIRLLMEMLQAPANARLLEIGAGTGRFTMPILERGYSITATDINGSMLDGLREKIKENNLENRCTCQQESVFDLSFDDESWDFIYSLHVLPRFLNIEDQVQAIKEIGRVLKPGGRFLFNYRNSRSPYRLLHKGHAAAPSEIEQALHDSGMKIIETRGKHFSNRKLYNKLPMAANHMLSGIDRMLHKTWTSRAWDVFVLAEKISQ